MKAEGRIVSIPNSYTVLIVSDSSLSIGDELEIFIPGPIIIDPDTKKELGSYDIIKDTVEVTRIYEQFYECRKIKTSEELIFPISPLHNKKTVTRISNLDVNTQNVDYALDKLRQQHAETLISVGDFIKRKKY